MTQPNLTPLFRQIIAPQTLYAAWRKVRANRGAAGVDAVSVRAFEKESAENIAELSRNLAAGTYEPLPARFVRVLKASGKERELGILTVRDRVAQRAALNAVEPLFEPQFLDCSYAFRPGRSVEMAVQRIVLARANGFRWTVESDIENFFPSLNQKILFREIKREMDDPFVLRLIEQWLEASRQDEDESESIGALARSAALMKRTASLARDTAWKILDDWVNEEYGESRLDAFVAGDAPDINEFAAHDEALRDSFEGEPLERVQTKRKSAWRKLMRDGLLMAFAERAVLRKFLSPRVMGLGGAALAVSVVAPVAVKAWRERRGGVRGALQGAPISPLLSNIYMHPFDLHLMRKGFRLIRYCDDFVLLCRTEEEAQKALAEARWIVAERGLKLNAEKTRVVRPDEEFDFLGYRFSSRGGARKTPKTLERAARKSATALSVKAEAASVKISSNAQRARTKLAHLLDGMSERLKSGGEKS